VKRVSTEKSPEARIDLLYRYLFQRSPKADEMASALSFVSIDEKPILAENDHAKAWQQGFGEWDEKTGRVKTFTPLPHFTGHAWQGDEDWPNAKLGWAQLTAKGGHPGNNRQHAVVRRWIAPADDRYDLRSTLIHEPKVGDGIRAFVSHSRLGKLLGTKLHGSKADLSLAAISFRAGDTLDFIVDIDIGLNSDQFLWSPQLSATQTIAASGGDVPFEVWDSKKDFTASPKTTLTSWEQLAQVLMLSNEFMFVD
jgi:hypothetical protein